MSRTVLSRFGSVHHSSAVLPFLPCFVVSNPLQPFLSTCFLTFFLIEEQVRLTLIRSKIRLCSLVLLALTPVNPVMSWCRGYGIARRRLLVLSGSYLVSTVKLN